jgi:hypothetical protein
MARIPIAVELIAVGVVAATALGFGINSEGIASGYVDPLLRAGAQDEAVYGHSAARMVRTGEWMTPIFLDRFMLNKPPLLMWAGAGSMRLFGIRPVALRAPVVLSGVLCCVVVYWWVRRTQPAVAALAGAVLLLGTSLFSSMSRRFMTDALLTLFVVAAIFVVGADLRWERRSTVILFGALSGAAVMTKSAAGLLPLLILAVYWIFAGSKDRPPLPKVLAACAVAVLVAAPWHVYEFVIHQDWFVAEYVRFQLLGSGVTAPSRYTGDTNLWFYFKTLLLTDPILLLLWATSVPWVVIGWKRSHEKRLLAAWFLTVTACLLIFGTRAAYYLMPLLPALVLMTIEFSPLLRGRFAWVALAVLLVAFGIQASNAPRNVPAASALESYSRLRRTNELLIVSPDDEFYASVVDLPKIRYVYLTPLDATKTSAFFYRLGMILTTDEFCSLERLMPVYEERLRDWKLPEGLHPEATLVDSGTVAELARVIRCSPDRDFMIPEAFRELAVAASAATHTATETQAGRFFLLSKNSSRRPQGSIALGALDRD